MTDWHPIHGVLPLHTQCTQDKPASEDKQTNCIHVTDFRLMMLQKKKKSVHFKLKVNLNRQQITHSNIEQYVYCFSIAYI